MPTGRPSTAMRPSSPLSPRFDGSSRYESLPGSRVQSLQQRSPNAQQSRRQYSNNLTLPGLPRFHPANFPSAHSSFATTPSSGPTSPHAPVSPQKLYADTQRQLNAYQRESFSRPSSSHLLGQPDSPKLQPLGSPGPVTPLELETAEGYLAISKSQSRTMAVDHPEELNKKLLQAARQRDSTPRIASSSLRPR